MPHARHARYIGGMPLRPIIPPILRIILPLQIPTLIGLRLLGYLHFCQTLMHRWEAILKLSWIFSESDEGKTRRGSSPSRFMLFFFLITSCTIGHAQIPLAVEGLLTAEHKLKLDAALIYANSDRRGFSATDPITIQTGPTSFVNIPTSVGESRRNSDSLIGTLGLRYGLSSKLEMFTRLTYLSHQVRVSDVSGVHRSSENRLSDAWLGANYKFKKDGEMPGIIGFAEVSLRERYLSSSSSLKSFLVGMTTYTAMDPVVFSLTAGYRFNQKRDDLGIGYKPGNLILLNPSIAFAANERASLITGMQWTSREADLLGDKVQGFRRTSTDQILDFLNTAIIAVGNIQA